MTSNQAHRDLALALAVGMMLLGAYVFAYSGMPESDDEQLFAAQSQNAAVLGNLNALQLFGNERLRGAAPGSEPLHPLLGSLFYKLAAVLKFGTLQAILLTNCFVTALSGALLCWLALKRRYSQLAALAVAFLFGLGTFALPYAASNYREPLSAFFLVVCLYCIELASQAKRGGKKLIWLTSAGAAFVMAVLTKVTCAVVLPFGIIYILFRRREVLPGRLLVLALVLLPLGALAAWFIARAVLPPASLGRISWDFVLHLAGALPDIKTDYFWRALFGLFISPAKGLIWYAPGLLLGLIAWKNKPARAELWLAWGAAFALAGVHARAYNQDWALVGWGVRPLVPVLSWLALACLPAIESLLSGKAWQRRLVWMLIGLGAFIQLPRLLAGDAAYVTWLAGQLGALPGEAQAWSWRFSPLWRQWSVLKDLPLLNVAWLRVGLAGRVEAYFVPLCSLVLIVLGVWLYQCVKKEMRIATTSVIGMVCLTLVMPWLGVWALRADPLYSAQREDFVHALEYLRQNARQPDAVLVSSYLEPLWLTVFNWGRLETEWVGLPAALPSVRYASPIYNRLGESSALARRLAKPPARVWLAEPCTSLAHRGAYFLSLKEAGFSVISEQFFRQSTPDIGTCLTAYQY